jgi:hypothetical protein
MKKRPKAASHCTAKFQRIHGRETSLQGIEAMKGSTVGHAVVDEYPETLKSIVMQGY